MSQFIQLDPAEPFAAPNSIVGTSSRGYASRTDWNRYHDIIKRLYVDEEKTLKEVMAIMDRDYGHRATIKMYKDRIKKWNLDKKTKEDEAWAILRLKVQRGRIGKDSVFRVRKKAVTVDDVLRYFKRKGIVNPEVEAQNHTTSTPPAIECWTPPSTPKPGYTTNRYLEHQEIVDFLGTTRAGFGSVSTIAPNHAQHINDNMLDYLNFDQTQQLLYSNPEIQSYEIPHSPLPPRSFLVAEKLFASIAAFYCGGFDKGLFKTGKTGYLMLTNSTMRNTSHADFYELCVTGVRLMRLNLFIEGRRCFSKASSLVCLVLRSQHPRALDFVFDALLYLKKRGHNEIATILQNLIHHVAVEILAAGHPWVQVFSLLSHLDDSYSVLVLSEAQKPICDAFINSLGQFHHTTVSCYGDSITKTHSSNALQLLRALLIQGEQQFDKFDERLVFLRVSIGHLLYYQNQYTEAIETLQSLTVQCKGLKESAETISDALALISLCQYQIGQRAEAECKLREAITLLGTELGKSDSGVLSYKALLGDWLRGWGRESEAAILDAEIDKSLGPDDIELELP